MSCKSLLLGMALISLCTFQHEASTADGCADYTVGTHFLNRSIAPWADPGQGRLDVRTVRARYPYLFASGGPAPLTAVGPHFEAHDISDPANPVHLASLSGVLRNTSDFVLVGDHAFLVGDQFSSVDISDPSNPVEVAAMPWPNGTVRMTYCQEVGMVFCGTPDSGLVAIDVSNPQAPSVVSTSPEFLGGSSYYRSIESSFPYIYAGPEAHTLEVYDVSDFLNPVEVLSLPGSAYTLQLVGDRLYAGGYDGLRIYDVLDPAAPALLGSVPGILVQDLWAEGARAWVNVDGRIDVYDVVDPTNPQMLRSTRVQHRSVWVQMDGAKGHLFAGGGDHNSGRGVSIAQIGDDAVATVDPVSSLGPLGSVQDLDAHGNRLLLVAFGGTSGMHSFEMHDCADPANPLLLGDLEFVSGSETSLASNDSMAFVTRSDEILVVDLRDPAAMAVYATVPLDFYAHDSGLTGSHLVVTTSSAEGIHVFDVSNPAAITQVGVSSLPEPGYVRDLWIDGDHVYLSWFTDEWGVPSGVAVIDISDPTEPLHVSTIALESRGMELVVHQSTLWATYGGNFDRYQLVGYDVSDPTNPVKVREVGLQRFTESLAAIGNHLYAGSDESGILVIDIADPASAHAIGNVDPGFSYVGKSAVIAGHLVAGSTINSTPTEDRVRLYAPQCDVVTAAPASAPDLRLLEISVKPNPFNPSVSIHFELAEATAAQVDVYDLQGRRIARLSSGIRPGGPQIVNWDGRDEAGRFVASGVYIVRAETPQGIGLSKVTLLK